MAAGIVAFAGEDLKASGDLGVPVRDALIEPRREDLGGTDAMAGGRVWVATGTELIAYDLATRDVAARWSVPGASAVAFDDNSLRLLVGTDDGEVLALDTSSMDLDRSADPSTPVVDPLPVATLGTPVVRLEPFQGGALAVAITADGAVDVFGIDSGEVVGTVSIPGASDLAAVDDVRALMAVPALVEDPPAAAARLAELIGGDETSLSRSAHGRGRGHRPDRREPDVRGAERPQERHGRR